MPSKLGPTELARDREERFPGVRGEVRGDLVQLGRGGGAAVADLVVGDLARGDQQVDVAHPKRVGEPRTSTCVSGAFTEGSRQV